MPKRNAFTTVVTSDLQGDDSFVVYKPMTYDEQRAFQKVAMEKKSLYDGTLENGAKELGLTLADLTDEQKADIILESGLDDTLIDYVNQVYAQRIVEWNWVDDDGNPLPQPKDNWSVLGKLYTPEHDFIASLFRPQTDENSKN